MKSAVSHWQDAAAKDDTNPSGPDFLSTGDPQARRKSLFESFKTVCSYFLPFNSISFFVRSSFVERFVVVCLLNVINIVLLFALIDLMVIMFIENQCE